MMSGLPELVGDGDEASAIVSAPVHVISCTTVLYTVHCGHHTLALLFSVLICEIVSIGCIG